MLQLRDHNTLKRGPAYHRLSCVTFNGYAALIGLLHWNNLLKEKVQL